MNEGRCSESGCEAMGEWDSTENRVLCSWHFLAQFEALIERVKAELAANGVLDPAMVP